jgi:hypothetical protein
MGAETRWSRVSPLTWTEEAQRLACFLWEIYKGEVPSYTDGRCDDTIHYEDLAPPSNVGQAVHLRESVGKYLENVNSHFFQGKG